MRSRPKVLHVIPSLSPHRGGPSFLLRSLATRMASAGLEIHVATTDDDGVGRREVATGAALRQEGVDYWFFPRQTRFYTFSAPLSGWLSRMAGRFDLIHVHALFSFPSVAAAFWAARRGVPYLVRPLGTLSQWGVENRRRWLKKISIPLVERRVLARAAAVHFTSQRELEEAALLGLQARSVVVPNAFDPTDSVGGEGERFRGRHPVLQGRKIALFLSRLDPKKGLDLLLAAFARIAEPTPLPALVVAGSGTPEFVAGLGRAVESLGIGDRVLFTGLLRGEEKRDALAAADFFVLPSYSENFGIAVVEAMAAGLPVVISDQVAISSDVSAAGAGLVVPCQVDALFEAMRRAFRETDEAGWGARAQRLCEERFSLDSVTKRLIRVYQDIVANPAGPISPDGVGGPGGAP